MALGVPQHGEQGRGGARVEHVCSPVPNDQVALSLMKAKACERCGSTHAALLCCRVGKKGKSCVTCAVSETAQRLYYTYGTVCLTDISCVVTPWSAVTEHAPKVPQLRNCDGPSWLLSEAVSVDNKVAYQLLAPRAYSLPSVPVQLASGTTLARWQAAKVAGARRSHPARQSRGAIGTSVTRTPSTRAGAAAQPAAVPGWGPATP